MTIKSILRQPIMRLGAAPDFSSRDDPPKRRWKRIRRWSDGPLVLPWISLNPSGKQPNGKGPTGRRIAAFAWRWGFDAVAVYNIFPFEASRPKHLSFWLLDRRGDENVTKAIDLCHDFTARDLSDVDAFVVAWGAVGGSVGRETQGWTERLLKRLPGEAWCLGVTDDGHPYHPSPLNASRTPNDLVPRKWVRQ